MMTMKVVFIGTFLTYSTCNYLDFVHEPKSISSKQVKVINEKYKNQLNKTKEIYE